MQLDSLLTPERTWCRAPVANAQALLAERQNPAATHPNLAIKQEVLASCARFFCENIGAAAPGLDAELLLQSLLARERLGSTGLGNGIAIPHCRLKYLDRVMGALITLAEPIDFDAVDGKPVDIIFVLLAPAQALQEHLNALAALAELFNRAEFRQRLRAAADAQQLYRAAVDFPQ